MMAIIQTRDFGIVMVRKAVLSHVNVDVPAGRFFALLGNGQVKRPLLKLSLVIISRPMAY